MYSVEREDDGNYVVVEKQKDELLMYTWEIEATFTLKYRDQGRRDAGINNYLCHARNSAQYLSLAIVFYEHYEEATLHIKEDDAQEQCNRMNGDALDYQAELDLDSLRDRQAMNREINLNRTFILGYA